MPTSKSRWNSRFRKPLSCNTQWNKINDSGMNNQGMLNLLIERINRIWILTWYQGIFPQRFCLFQVCNINFTIEESDIPTYPGIKSLFPVVPGIGRQIIYCWTTGEAFYWLSVYFISIYLFIYNSLFTVNNFKWRDK